MFYRQDLAIPTPSPLQVRLEDVCRWLAQLFALMALLAPGLLPRSYTAFKIGQSAEDDLGRLGSCIGQDARITGSGKSNFVCQHISLA
jgi:hypothetical protein